jgi:hypothetical protein
MNVHVKHSSNEDMHILKKKDLDLYILCGTRKPGVHPGTVISSLHLGSPR